MDLRNASGAEVRARAARGELVGPTAGLALGYVQANLVIVPKDLAFDFLLFCQRNPKPCPLLDVAEPGSPEPRLAAPGADLRSDLPRYSVYERGRLVAEPDDLHNWWRDDLVSFLLGCSFTFEGALLEAGLPVRHLELGCNVPMYRTNIPCRPAGTFRGPMVVSMRPMSPAQAIEAVQISPLPAGSWRSDPSRRPRTHRDSVPRPTGLWRPGRSPFRRDTRLLGLRRHASGACARSLPIASHHPQTGAHVCHRPSGVTSQPIFSLRCEARHPVVQRFRTACNDCNESRNSELPTSE